MAAYIEASPSDDGMEAQNPPTHAIGGNQPKPAFALLDGFFEDPDTHEFSRVTIPITRIPAMLGRTHVSDDANFFGLGRKKVLSRKQCAIYYRNADSGSAEQETGSNEVVYNEAPRPNDSLIRFRGNEDGDESERGEPEDLPKNGFFVIECLGKNRILVDRMKVEQNKSAVLRPGAAIRISNFMLYFLLPTDATPKRHVIRRAITRTVTVTKKRKKAKPASTGTTTAATTPGSPAPKKSRMSAGATFQAELDQMPLQELMDLMEEAVKKEIWDRKNQLIGYAICQRALKEVAEDPQIKEITAKDGGVSRNVIMQWMEDSAVYGNWVKQMTSKMEHRSYQTAVSKCLARVGYARLTGSGRYIKWSLPGGTEGNANPKENVGNEGDNENQEDDEENDDDDDDSDGDDDDDDKEGATSNLVDLS